MRALLVLVALTPPVPGTITRGFEYQGDPFARGHHRGIDLAAAPGTPVKAACSGRVTFAGQAGENGNAVTIRCGPWSVTQLPLDTVTARAGANVPAGTRLGTAATTRHHAGLHLGVRRTTDPHGYIDPAPLLRGAPRPAPPAALPREATRHRSPPPHPAPLPSGPAPRTAPQPSSPAVGRAAPPAAAPAAPPARAPAARPGSSPLAPWPAWAGLALLLAGATGAGAARRARARRAPQPQATAAPVR